MPVDPKTDEILDQLIDAQDRLDQVRAENAAREAEALTERDAALVRARKTGTNPTKLAQMLNVRRATIYDALNRAGLK